MKDDVEGNRQIAIDGPAGAGKSTVAKQVAKRLGFLYLDTGAMYRALTYKALKQQVPVSDEARISGLARDTEIHFSAERRVWCDGEDVTQAIRTPEVSRAVSIVSAYPEVRKRLVDLQRTEAGRHGVVMDGRDIGTHVLPKARLKIFLTATLEVRAQRRWLELRRSGKEMNLSDVQREMEERDHKDASRTTAPLQAAPDAFVFDTTGLGVEEIVNKILAMVQEV